MSYKTYQEAKIAMPLACIIHDADNDRFFGMPSREGTILTDDGCKFAEPQNYCMTVEKFLCDGHKFTEGDIYLNSDGRTLGVVNIPGYNNKRSTIDCNLYILRAAALETMQPRAKHFEVKKEVHLRDYQKNAQTEHQEEMSAFSGEGEWLSVGAIVSTSYGDGEVLTEAFVDGYSKWLVQFKDTYRAFDEKDLSKPETPQQREDRERLEAAYDLFVHVQQASNRDKWSFELFCNEKMNDYKIDYLAIVDKTNYRKG